MKRARLCIFVILSLIAVMVFVTACSDKGGGADPNANDNVADTGADTNEKYSDIYNYSLKILSAYEHSRIIAIPAETDYLTEIDMGVVNGLTELIYAFIPASSDSDTSVLKTKVLFFSNDATAKAYFDEPDSVSKFLLGNKVFLNFPDNIRLQIDAALPITVPENVKNYTKVLLDNDFYVILSEDPVIAPTDCAFMLGGGNSANGLGSIINQTSISESADLSYNIAVNFYSDNASALAALGLFGELTFDEEKNAYFDEDAPNGMDKIYFKVVDNIFFQCRYNVYNALINGGSITSPELEGFTVRFYDGDTLLKTDIVSYGGKAIAPIVEAKESWFFNGWDKEFSNVTGDLIVTAIRTKPIKSIAYKQGSMKEQYFTDEKLTTENGKLIVTFTDNSAEEVPILPYMVNSFNTDYASNRRQAWIQYKGHECSFNYSVALSDLVESIELIAPNIKKEYFWGEEFQFGDGAKVKVNYKNGVEKFVSMSEVTIQTPNTTPWTYNNFDRKYLSLEISYKGVKCSIDYTVKKDFTKAELIGKPKTEYIWGEEADLNGVKLSVEDLSGNVSMVEVTDDMLRIDTMPSYVPSSSYETGFYTQTITLSYHGVEITNISYTVKLLVKSMSIHTPFKCNYIWGEPLDVSGGKLQVNYLDGTNEIIDISKDMVSSFSSQPSPNTVSTYESYLQIKHMGYRLSIPYTVISDVESFSIEEGTMRTNFKLNEKIDLAEQKTIMNVKYKNGDVARVYIVNRSNYSFSAEIVYRPAYYSINTNYVYDYPSFMYDNPPSDSEALNTETVAIYNFDTTKAGTFEMEIVYHLKVIKVQYTVE